ANAATCEVAARVVCWLHSPVSRRDAGCVAPRSQRLKELHKCPQQIPKQSAPSLAARARRRSSPTENSFGSNRSPRHKARICAREMEGRFIPSLDYGLHLLGSLFFLEPLLVDRRRRTALLAAVARY